MEPRKCPNCEELFIPNKFHPHQKYCSKECLCRNHAPSHKYRLSHLSYFARWHREVRKKFKKEIFGIIGSKCVICGYDGIALQIDHINNEGYKTRVHGKRGASEAYYRRVLKEIKAGSKNYQPMCPTHNMEKEMLRRLK